MELIRIRFKCEECGCAVLTVEDDPSDDSWVTCKDCGWIYGRFKHLKVDTVHDALTTIFVKVGERFKKRL